MMWVSSGFQTRRGMISISSGSQLRMSSLVSLLIIPDQYWTKEIISKIIVRKDFRGVCWKHSSFLIFHMVQQSALNTIKKAIWECFSRVKENSTMSEMVLHLIKWCWLNPIQNQICWVKKQFKNRWSIVSGSWQNWQWVLPDHPLICNLSFLLGKNFFIIQ